MFIYQNIVNICRHCHNIIVVECRSDYALNSCQLVRYSQRSKYLLEYLEIHNNQDNSSGTRGDARDCIQTGEGVPGGEEETEQAGGEGLQPPHPPGCLHDGPGTEDFLDSNGIRASQHQY